MDEKIEFSQRLRDAMVRAGYSASPSVLEHEFNLRWQGRSISNQAAWGWLNNRAIPTQDKLQILAEWLKVEPEVLRVGARLLNCPQQQSAKEGATACSYEPRERCS